MTIQDLASQYLEYFEWKRPDDKDKNEYYYVREDAPMEIHTFVRDVHGDWLPDSYKYDFIVEALQAISDFTGEEEDIEEILDEIEPDAYDYSLLDWLSSNVNRLYYVNLYYNSVIEEVGNLGHGGGIMEDIAMGQVAEKREVYEHVINYLLTKLDEYNYSDDYDEEEDDE